MNLSQTNTQKLGSAKVVTIKSIEFDGEEPVYNMEVEKNHNYIANGLILHNCDSGRYTLYTIVKPKTRFYGIVTSDDNNIKQ